MDSVWMILTMLLLMLASWLLRRLWLTISHLLYDGHAHPVVVIEFLVLILHRLLPVHNSQAGEDFLYDEFNPLFRIGCAPLVSTINTLFIDIMRCSWYRLYIPLCITNAVFFIFFCQRDCDPISQCFEGFRGYRGDLTRLFLSKV